MPNQEYGYCYMGVDYATPPHKLPVNAIADAQNVLPTEAGLVSGRAGSVALNSTALGTRVTSVFEFRSGSSVKTLGSYSTKIAEYNAGTGEFVDVITGLTSNKMMQWVNFGGKAIGVNEGSDAPQYYSSSVLCGALAGSPPKGNNIIEWGNRVWLGGDSTNVAALTGSKLNDPTDWSAVGATGHVSQTIGDAKDPIIGLFGYFDWLLVGKLNNLYKVTGTPITDATGLSITPIFSKSDDNIGFTSPWAITMVGKDVLFLDGYDIKRLSGIQEYGDVETASIIPQYRDFLKDTVDQDYLQYAQFFHYKQKYQVWVTIPTGASTHHVFVIDYRFKDKTSGQYAVFPMSNLTVNCFGGVKNGEVVDMYYGDEAGKAHKLDTGNNDNGSAIERFVTFSVSGQVTEQPFQPAARHVYRKQFINTEAFILSEQAALSMTPYYALDLMDSAQVRTSGNFTAFGSETVTDWNGTGVKHKRISFMGLSGNAICLKWYQSAVNQNFTIYPSEVNFKYKSKTLIT